MKIKKSFLIAALLLFELCLLLAVIWGLNLEAAYLYGAMEFISVAIVVMLIYSRDNPSYKITWSIIILVFPLFGVFIYFIAGTHYLSPKFRRLIKKSKALGRRLRCQKPQIFDELRKQGNLALRQAQFILSLCDKPVHKATQAKLLLPGEKMYESMLEELLKAEKFIFIEFFIIAKGEMFNTIFNILKRKAAAGVEIRIIFDDAGSMDRMPPNFRRECARLGIKTAAFNPFIPLLNKFMDYRDHRKIVVVDGNVGFTGGINIGDEYINRIALHGHWYDGGIRLRGDAVWNFTVMFLDMWMLITNEPLNNNRYLVTERASDDGYVQPFNDSPFTGNAAEGAYMQIINTAGRYVYISTPYLIIDHEMMITLCNTSHSGIDVRIVTPHIADKSFVHAVTRGYYQQLMDSGVKIYEYTPGFIHAKMILCDDDTGVIGSVNMDYRSFYQQFEDAVWLYKNSALIEMKEEFIKIFEASALIDSSEWKKRGLHQKAAEMFLRLFAPLM
jgi:cardiolipin synthase A/B